MKEKIFKFKSIFYLITLLSIVILCNVSVVQADSLAPTECRISINNNALYTNNRYVTLELYANDADPLQVWISNDGENGTVIDFSYGTTYTIDDLNYTVGVDLDESNSTVTTNQDNVVRIVNWPLSSINGTKKVYAVFRDSFGNKTSTSGLSTITVSFDLNGMSGDAIAPVTTVKNLGVYMPNPSSNVVYETFVGWSLTKGGNIPSYNPNSFGIFTTSTTIYGIKKSVKVGDYVYYDIDTSKNVNLTASLTNYNEDQILRMDDPLHFTTSKQLFKVLSISDTNISLSPMVRNQVFSIYIHGKSAAALESILSAVCALYETKYTDDTLGSRVVSANLMKTFDSSQENFITTDLELTTLFSEYGYTGAKKNTNVGYFIVAKIGDYDHGLMYYHPNENGTFKTNAYVYPEIILKSNVRFSGSGTQESPYTLNLINE